MVFTSPTFLFAFLPGALLCYYFAPNVIKNSVLLLASLLFYAWGELAFVLLLLLSIIVNYIFGRLIGHYRTKRFLVIGVGINLAFLIFYKYFHFLLLNINLGSEFSSSIYLPLGISFFTFQAISYLIDISRNDVKSQRNIIDLGLYIAFFPQLIAGPIVRYHHIAMQLFHRLHSAPLFVSGVERFSYGLAKKIIIANALGAVADPIFALDSSQISLSLAWLALVCYALQIYFDFSAYSDMAIGLARMFGFSFQENFNYPYVSRSLKEFWQRWHISLSHWFRDYLYIPLGGNRQHPFRTYVNLMAVFVLCGLWHGASWNFLVWGLIHGSFLIIERLGLSQLLVKAPAFIARIYTLFVVIIAWVFFRTENLTEAMEFLCILFYIQHSDHYLYSIHYFINTQFIITAMIALVLTTPVFSQYVSYYPRTEFHASFGVSVKRMGLIFTALFFSALLVSASTYNPFIYFRF